MTAPLTDLSAKISAATWRRWLASHRHCCEWCCQACTAFRLGYAEGRRP